MRRVILMNDEGWPGMDRAIECLSSGFSPMDVVEASIREVEREPRVRSVGFGGAPNALGVMQLDASCMDGDTLETGAVAALEGIAHPISVARELGRRLPHNFLVGEGAKRFALEAGFPEEDLLSKEAQESFQKWRAAQGDKSLFDVFDPAVGGGSHGTVISLVRNELGQYAGGVSTSGWDYKYPGRAGDSCLIGAGLFVDSRYGAAACTHCGENAIRACLARSVVLLMQKGAAVQEAVAEAIGDLQALKGGYQGQVAVYALDKAGNSFVGCRYRCERPMYSLFWTDGMSAFQKVDAQPVTGC